MPTLYIATTLSRWKDHNIVRDAFVARGWTVTYDWTLAWQQGPTSERGPEALTEVADVEVEGVRDADLVVVLLPGGRGTHAELGGALIAGKPVLLHSQDVALITATPETCAFYHHRLVTRVGPNVPLEALPSLVPRLVRQKQASTIARGLWTGYPASILAVEHRCMDALMAAVATLPEGSEAEIEAHARRILAEDAR